MGRVPYLDSLLSPKAVSSSLSSSPPPPSHPLILALLPSIVTCPPTLGSNPSRKCIVFPEHRAFPKGRRTELSTASDRGLFYFILFISWRLITLQYCSGFCHILTWISHGFTCIPHPDPPSHLPLHSIPLGLPSAPGPSSCLMHLTRAGDLFHPR